MIQFKIFFGIDFDRCVLIIFLVIIIVAVNTYNVNKRKQWHYQFRIQYRQVRGYPLPWFLL